MALLDQEAQALSPEDQVALYMVARMFKENPDPGFVMQAAALAEIGS